MPYPKRLIEVDLPIKRISAHARREKSIRHGHISTLHIWWARRPLAACRAVLCAALWPDPADPDCPPAFRQAAARIILDFARKVASDTKLANDHCSPENFKLWQRLAGGAGFQPAPQPPPAPKAGLQPPPPLALRSALLDFIADFANWDNSTVREYLDAARLLTAVAHNSLSDPSFELPPEGPDWLSTLSHQLSTRPKPLVVDPFAGGGSIPLEALRVGADAFASDLNPIPVLLNKVVLEYIPKYGQRLADEVRKWGDWIKREAEKELAEFYPKDPGGATPSAYLWARTIRCEGPGCGAEVPLLRSLWLAKTPNRSFALQLVPRPRVKRVDFSIIQKQERGWVAQDDPTTKVEDPKLDGTVKRGSATCPCCGFTTPVAHVRGQLRSRQGGTSDARLFCIITTCDSMHGRAYRLPTDGDLKAVLRATDELGKRTKAHKGPLSLVPNEKLDIRGVRHTWSMIYGFRTWDSFYLNRQLLALVTLQQLLPEIKIEEGNNAEHGLTNAVRTCLALAVSRQTDYTSSLCSWHLTRELIGHTFTRQALPMIWDFAEVNPFSGTSGDFEGAVEWVFRVCRSNIHLADHSATAQQASATEHPLPSDSADLFVTDPPYYDAVPYAYLSDYFYVWLRRSLINQDESMFRDGAVPKDQEIVVDRPHELSNSTHDIDFYERALTKAFAEGRRVLRPEGIGTIVFASKTTSSWEAILKAVIDAGWIISGSWPIDTEMESRVAAQGQARLASSVHLVCRPRENQNGTTREDEIGDWRDVLQELPRRIHGWMPRLAEEGVVGADAIFACLGPALEVFSRYSRVEKANGEPITLHEYLEHTWAAVSREALHLILHNGDATGFDPDARLTVIWFWVLQGASPEPTQPAEQPAEDEGEDEDSPAKPSRSPKGFSMEYDAARKLAQGLGAELSELTKSGGILTIRGNVALLNTVSEREATLCIWQPGLLGGSLSTSVMRHRVQEPKAKLRAVAQRQPAFWQEGTQPRSGHGPPFLPGLAPPKDDRSLIQRLIQSGSTTLGRLHQAMLLFGRGQTALIGQFLTDSGAGNDQRFWRLAQALSALYPRHTEEKRWVDGVLARKKGLGF